MNGLDEDRAIADLRRLAGFGKYETGVHRPAMSDADFAARQWLCEEMRAAGLEAEIDGVGTVLGRAPRASVALLLGSHSDSVPYGGWLDGAMGCIFALAVARARQSSDPGAAVGVDAVSFSDEEGTFMACGGSRVFCGEIGLQDFAEARNASGERFVDRLDAFGLAGRPLARLDPARHRAFLEAHIEQGPQLVEAGLDVGAVSGIVGLRRRRATFHGQADHAGTTPMAMRRDAGAAMHAFAVAARETLLAAGSPDSVCNIGVVAVRPGAPNVVPHEAEIVVEFRDLSSEVMERMDAALRALIAERDGAGGVRIESAMIGIIEPTHMDERLTARVERAAAQEGAKSLRMQSGAGHDAMILGRRIPAAMLFAPSLGGRSHHISEDTDEADIRRALRVYARAADALLHALGPDGRGAL
jgi:beta-ureidopropionase / N-carbamoyl-L-amino-acid hydrolase